MKSEITYETPMDIRPGRPSLLDYAIFQTDALVKFVDTDHDKVRAKINNVGTQAKLLGYSVRTYMLRKGKVYIGCVTRKQKKS